MLTLLTTIVFLMPTSELSACGRPCGAPAAVPSLFSRHLCEFKARLVLRGGSPDFGAAPPDSELEGSPPENVYKFGKKVFGAVKDKVAALKVNLVDNDTWKAATAVAVHIPENSTTATINAMNSVVCDLQTAAEEAVSKMQCTSFWRPAATQNAVSDGTTFVFVRYENSTYRVFMDVGSTVSAFQMQLYLATGVLPMCQRLVGFEGMRFFTHTDIVLTLNAYADSRTHTSCSQRMHSPRSYTLVASS